MEMKLVHHLLLAWFLRLVLVVYGEWHDANMHLPYTDVDYKVFTDAARHLSVGDSPYKRSTYRYPPILAALLLPNIWIHKSVGKILFASVDVVAGWLGILLSGSKRPHTVTLLIWLYNPLPAIVSTRGNADSLTAALVTLSLISIRQKNVIISGVILAFAAHLRVYPILFALPIWLAIGQYPRIGYQKKEPGNVKIKDWVGFFFSLIMQPSCFKFIFALTSSLTLLTAVSYSLFGYEFLQESYLYHLTRIDTRHNFSVHFYLLYLGGSTLLSLLAFLPQLIVLIVLGFRYGTPRDVPFACFCQAFVFVTFNKVVTAQYFLWPLSLLPAIVPVIIVNKPSVSIEKTATKEKLMRKSETERVPSSEVSFNWKKLILYTGAWSFSVGIWLLAAYLLEFHGLNTFLFIWVAGILFFGTSAFILREIVVVYEDGIQLQKHQSNKSF